MMETKKVVTIENESFVDVCALRDYEVLRARGVASALNEGARSTERRLLTRQSFACTLYIVVLYDSTDNSNFLLIAEREVGKTSMEKFNVAFYRTEWFVGLVFWVQNALLHNIILNSMRTNE
ncbi:hypothetical protein SFRURICE_003705 [Spodoptera frugiperda]|nr:hypothetical protein SFRURICE_003705 [Spodoptera frugiperda]